MKSDKAQILELQTTVTRVKNSTEGFSGRGDQLERKVSEDSSVEIIQSGEQREGETADSLGEYGKPTSRPVHTGTFGKSRVRGKKKREESLFKKITMEDFPNLGWEGDNRIQEAQTIPDRMSTKRSRVMHVITQFSKIKAKRDNFESSKRKMTCLRDPLPL